MINNNMLIKDTSFLSDSKFKCVYHFKDDNIPNSSYFSIFINILLKSLKSEYRNSNGCIVKFHLIPLHYFKEQNNYGLQKKDIISNWRLKVGYGEDNKDMITFLRPRDYLKVLMLQLYYFNECNDERMKNLLINRIRFHTSVKNFDFKRDFPEWFYQKFEEEWLSKEKCHFNVNFLYLYYQKYKNMDLLKKMGYKYSLRTLKENYQRNILT